MVPNFEQLVERMAASAAQHATEVDRGNFPKETIGLARETRLLGLTSSKDVGGMGEGHRAASYLIERVSRECGSTGMVLCMHFSATAMIEPHGPREVREAIAAGRHLATVALSEVGSRSEFWIPVSSATPDGDDVLLTAQKSFVTSVRHADVYVWGSKPITNNEISTLWLVPRETFGLQHGLPFDGVGLRGNDSGPLTAENVRVPASARLGDDGGGFPIVMSHGLTCFNILASSVSAGLMEAVVQKTVAHAAGAKFQHLGSMLADLPTIRAYIARMRIATDQIKTLLADTITAVETDRPDKMLRVLESKAAAGEAAGMVTDLAMRVCGGVAFRKDVGIERMFRDARASHIMAPTTDQLYDKLGRAVCGMPLF
ncbi:MAG TPA: acyl-CoA dehydrogenase family protein [Kofleriaceae bacterium]|nr:acyl-CoA dehydrogenase family protein [Kofleriaceae bacterium]